MRRRAPSCARCSARGLVAGLRVGQRAGWGQRPRTPRSRDPRFPSRAPAVAALRVPVSTLLFSVVTEAAVWMLHTLTVVLKVLQNNTKIFFE